MLAQTDKDYYMEEIYKSEQKLVILNTTRLSSLLNQSYILQFQIEFL